MARTKADAYTKAAVKAPRKTTVLRGDRNKAPKVGKKDKRNSGGGNPYCPRATPSWQKPITSFMRSDEMAEKDPNGQGTQTKGVVHQIFEPCCSKDCELYPGEDIVGKITPRKRVKKDESDQQSKYKESVMNSSQISSGTDEEVIQIIGKDDPGPFPCNKEHKKKIPSANDAHEPVNSCITHDSGSNDEHQEKSSNKNDAQEPVDSCTSCDSGNNEAQQEKSRNKNDAQEPVDSCTSHDSGNNEEQQEKFSKDAQEPVDAGTTHDSGNKSEDAN